MNRPANTLWCRNESAATLRSGHLSPPDSRQIDAYHTVPPRRPLLRRGRKRIEPLRNAHVFEPGLRERRHKLCFQQSTRDSTGPQIDVSSRLLGKLDAKHDVRDLNAAAWLQDAPNLGDRHLLLSNEVQHAVRDHHVDAFGLDG
jgi:hypothetical protein